MHKEYEIKINYLEKDNTIMRNGFEDKIAKLEQKFKLQLDEKEIEYEAISKQITKLQNQS